MRVHCVLPRLHATRRKNQCFWSKSSLFRDWCLLYCTHRDKRDMDRKYSLRGAVWVLGCAIWGAYRQRYIAFCSFFCFFFVSSQFHFISGNDKWHNAAVPLNNPLSPGSLSYYILWSDPDFRQGLKNYINRFNIYTTHTIDKQFNL